MIDTDDVKITMGDKTHIYVMHNKEYILFQILEIV